MEETVELLKETDSDEFRDELDIPRQGSISLRIRALGQRVLRQVSRAARPENTFSAQLWDWIIDTAEYCNPFVPLEGFSNAVTTHNSGYLIVFVVDDSCRVQRTSFSFLVLHCSVQPIHKKSNDPMLFTGCTHLLLGVSVCWTFPGGFVPGRSIFHAAP